MEPAEQSEMLEFVKALSHADRLRVVGVLARKPASTKEISDALGMPFRDVVQHVDMLAHAGVILDQGGSWSIDSICEPKPGWKTTIHVDVTGSFESKFTSVIDATTTGAPLAAAHGTHRTVLVATWLGPCKPGQKGGDVTMSNGYKVNILDAAKAKH